jgi:hypothetical protein
MVSRGPFKRNQLEEALAFAIHVRPPVSQDLRLDIRRLLEIDRAIGSDPKAKHPEDYYFAFSYFPPSGSGRDVWFFDYDVFAVYVAVRLLRSGYPQRRVVRLMRGLRPTLDAAHRKILSSLPADLLDNDTAPDLDAAIASGTLVTKLDRMVCLVLGAGKHSGLTYRNSEDRDRHLVSNICESKDALDRLLQLHLADHEPAIVIELVNPAHQIAYWLDRIEPSKRGR